MSTQSEHNTPTISAYTEEPEIQCSVSPNTIPENLEQCGDTDTLANPENFELGVDIEEENSRAFYHRGGQSRECG